MSRVSRRGSAPNDVVLEPSAGTGMLAIFAELAGAKLILNEWARDARRSPETSISRRRRSAASTARSSTIASTPIFARASC